MRMVKICMFIFCAAMLFAPQAAQSEEMSQHSSIMRHQNPQHQTIMRHGTNQPHMMQHNTMTQPKSHDPEMMGQEMPKQHQHMMQDPEMGSMPRHYTSPNGVTKHRHPPVQRMSSESIRMRQQMMQPSTMNQQMGMYQGTVYRSQTSHPALRGGCPMCAKINAASLTPQQRANLLRTLTEFSSETDPMYNKLLMLKQEKLNLQRSAFDSPAKRANIEVQREQVRKALMGKLKRQQKVLNSEYGLNVTSRDMLLHRIHRMKMQSPGTMQVMHSQPVQTQVVPVSAPQGTPHGYRSPQEMNPNYNQEYLMNAPMREAYTGQTYQ